MAKQLTELQAVNLMLGFIGNSPINTLDSAGRIGEQAQSVLSSNKSNELQKSWWFNTNDVELSPNINKEILIPDNAIQVTTSGSQDDFQVIGGKLFSISGNTFEYDAPVTVQIVYDLDWEDLPYSVQYFIAMTSVRDLYSMRFPKGDIPKHIQEKFIYSRNDVHRFDLNSAKYNFGTNSDITDIIN